jgi:hypothetical protein
MAINTSKQFASGLKLVGTQTSKTRDLVQELLITAVFFAERDGDVAPINRVIDAIRDTKALDLWKAHKWLKTYEAPCKPSEDGKTYVFDAKKRHLQQGAQRADFIAYETVMRQEPAWYELTKSEATPAQVWNAENAFESFIKKLEKEGYNGEVVSALNKEWAKLSKSGKVVRIIDTIEEATI